MNLLSIDANIIPNVRLIGHVSYTKPWIHFERTINEYILYIVKSGELYIQEGDMKYSLKKGDMLLLEPNIAHKGFKPSCCHYYYIHFKHPSIHTVINKSYDEISQYLIQRRKQSLSSNIYEYDIGDNFLYYFPKYYHIENENEIMTLLTIIDNVFYEKYEGYKRIASLKFLELLITISKDYTSTKISSVQAHFSKAFVKCRSIINYLNKNYSKKINSKDIEEIFESNYDYLNRVFHKMTGYTITNYLNYIRINRAKELLITTPIKISDVSYLVGIDDPYYFSKLFKKYTGMSPTQYLKDKNNMDI